MMGVRRRGRCRPPNGQFNLLLVLRAQIDLGEEEVELLIVEGLLGLVGQDSPCMGDEPEGLVGEGVLVLVRVKKESHAAVLLLDEIEVVGAAIQLEDSVPIVMVVDAPLGGQEYVDNRQDLIGAVQKGLCLLGQDGELP